MASPRTDSSIDSDSSSLHEEDPSTRPEAERSQWRSGYDCQFVGEILPEEGECPICHLIHRHPYQLRCGKRICKECIEKIRAKSQLCPFCNEVDVTSFPDVAHMQYLGRYNVNCPNRSKGCEWEGQLADLDRHLNLETATEKQLKGCLFSRIKCKFRAVGCQVELLHKDMPEHERQSVAEHSVALSRTLQRALADITSLQGDITSLQGDSTSLQGDITSLQGDITTLQGDSTSLQGDITTLRGDSTSFRRDITSLQGDSTSLQGDITTLQGDSTSLRGDITSLQGDITTLRGDSTSFRRDITSLQGDSTSLQGDITFLQGKMQALISNNEQTTGAMQDSLNAMRDSLNAMRDGQDKMQERITAQGKRSWGVAILAIVAIVSIAVLAGVVTMRSGQHSVNGIQYREDRTGFCRFDDGMMESECIDKEAREEWCNELDSRMEHEQKERRDELDRRMEQAQKERRDELDRRMEQAQKKRRDELDRRMEQAQKERRDELDRRMEQSQKERRNELDSGMEQAQKERRNELDRRMEQAQKERCNELDRRMEQAQKERRNELDSRMEQKQKERRNELDSRMEQEQKERRNELDSRMEQAQTERRDELDSGMEQAQKERRNELDRRMEQAQKERHDELDSRMEQAQKERRDELDSRMEQEQTERHNELDRRMEQAQKERRNKLDRRMEQEQTERRDELDRKVEEVLLQVSEYETAERQERQQLQGQLSELQDQLDQDIETRQKTDIEHSHEVAGVDVNMLQVRQNAVLKHLRMFPHEDILPFEFEIKEFKKNWESGNLWYSPPFYTDINGYKMCICVEARGKDGKYVSVTAFLMAGVADDDLKWPFREDITIELMNQASSSRWNPLSYFRSKKESHFKTFQFKTTRVPKSNRRVTSGERALDGLRISRFIAHDNLENDSEEGTQYLKDDTLKFRISASSA